MTWNFQEFARHLYDLFDVDGDEVLTQGEWLDLIRTNIRYAETTLFALFWIPRAKKASKYMKMLETLVKGNVSIIFRRMERGRSWKYLKLQHTWFAKIVISHKTIFEKFWTVEMFHWNCSGLLIKMEMATCLFLR